MVCSTLCAANVGTFGDVGEILTFAIVFSLFQYIPDDDWKCTAEYADRLFVPQREMGCFAY
jgi:hypothetical protein